MNICIENQQQKITFRVATKRAEKHKWMCRFTQSYKGKLEKVGEAIYGNSCKFIIAESGGKELGFIRISDYSDDFKRFGVSVFWNISDAYVKPAYRSQGVLKALIKYAVDSHNVKSIRAETKRLEQNQFYYQSLGFNEGIGIGDGYMGLIYLDEVKESVHKRLSYYQTDPALISR